jgi:hypothetical protein
MMRLAKILATELCCAWWPWGEDDRLRYSARLVDW